MTRDIFPARSAMIVTFLLTPKIREVVSKKVTRRKTETVFSTRLWVYQTLYETMLQNPPNWEELYRKTIYAVSHDLGAPCRHIRSFSELLLENAKGLDDDSKSMLNHIHQAGEEVQAMLEGLLKLSRIYSRPGRLSVVRGEALSERFACATENLREDSHILVNLDQLEHAVQELVDNSKQYGDFVGINLHSRPKWFCLTVLDKGPGIDESDWEDSLQPLQRIGQRRSSEHVGMGLPIAQAIANQMKGSLVNRPEGITIELPLL